MKEYHEVASFGTADSPTEITRVRTSSRGNDGARGASALPTSMRGTKWRLIDGGDYRISGTLYEAYPVSFGRE
jgi:hypothetical protein